MRASRAARRGWLPKLKGGTVVWRDSPPRRNGAGPGRARLRLGRAQPIDSDARASTRRRAGGCRGCGQLRSPACGERGQERLGPGLRRPAGGAARSGRRPHGRSWSGWARREMAWEGGKAVLRCSWQWIAKLRCSHAKSRAVACCCLLTHGSLGTASVTTPHGCCTAAAQMQQAVR